MSQGTSGGAGTQLPAFDSVPAFDSLLTEVPGGSALQVASVEDDDPADTGATDQSGTHELVFDFADREPPRRPRTSVLGWASLVLAFFAPPLGLVLSIVARVIARHRHGWRTWPVTLATGVSIALTVLLIVGGFVAGILGTQTAGVDAIVADSAEFCDSLATTPGVLDTAGFGWPTESSSVKKSIAAMTGFRDRWSALAEIAPAGIAGDVQAIATLASNQVDSATVSQSIDPQASLDLVSATTNATGIRAYTTKYCR